MAVSTVSMRERDALTPETPRSRDARFYDDTAVWKGAPGKMPCPAGSTMRVESSLTRVGGRLWLDVGGKGNHCRLSWNPTCHPLSPCRTSPAWATVLRCGEASEPLGCCAR